MKVLISVTCAAVLVFIGYFFWGEYEKYQALQTAQKIANAIHQADLDARAAQRNRECDERVRELKSWIASKPEGQSKSFLEARGYVDQCLKGSEGTDWYEKNIHIKYW